MKTPPAGAADCRAAKCDMPIKTKPPSFNTLVARYHRVIYSLALRITDDPLEAVLLTRDAFIRTRKELRSRRGEAIIVRMLIAAVLQGLNARRFN
jgi:hypothetical protein